MQALSRVRRLGNWFYAHRIKWVFPLSFKKIFLTYQLLETQPSQQNMPARPGLFWLLLSLLGSSPVGHPESQTQRPLSIQWSLYLKKYILISSLNFIFNIYPMQFISKITTSVIKDLLEVVHLFFYCNYIEIFINIKPNLKMIFSQIIKWT